MKTCTKCGVEKELTEFYTRQSRPLARCKKCTLEANKGWTHANQEKAKAGWKAWRLANPSRVKERGKRWRDANLEKERARHREIRRANPEKARAVVKVWILENLQRHRGVRKAWRDANTGRVRGYSEKGRASLTPSYVAAVMGLHTPNLTPELLELKREQLTLYRLSKEIKTKLKENTK